MMMMIIIIITIIIITSTASTSSRPKCPHVCHRMTVPCRRRTRTRRSLPSPGSSCCTTTTSPRPFHSVRHAVLLPSFSFVLLCLLHLLLLTLCRDTDPNEMEYVFKMQNSTGGVNSDCIASLPAAVRPLLSLVHFFET